MNGESKAKRLSGVAWPSFAVGVLYFAGAQIGLKLAFQGSNVSAVWPPSGVALAGVMLAGYRVCPGIFLGAFAAHFLSFAACHPLPLSAFLPASLAIAVGSTLEAACGVLLLHTFVGPGDPFERVDDALKFVGIVLVMCLVSAGIGPVAVCWSGFEPWASFSLTAFTWWLGSVAGILLVTPLVVVWHRPSNEPWSAWRLAEGAALLVVFTVTFLFVFVGEGVESGYYIPGYLLIPVLVWSVLRLSHRVGAVALALVSGLAVWGTVNRMGPFVRPSVSESLLLLQGFVCVAAFIVVTLATALTERYAAHQESGRSQGLLNLVVQRTTDLVFIKDTGGRYVAVNATASRFFGRPVDDIIGQTCAEVFTPEESGRMLAMDDQVLSTGMPVSDEHVIHTQAGPRTLLTTKVPYHDGRGNVLGLIGISRDITERRSAEVGLVRHRMLLETVLTQAADAIVVSDAEGTVMFANEAARDLAGITAKGKKLDMWRDAWGDAFEPDGAPIPAEERPLRKALRGEADLAREVHMVRPDGSTYDILISAVPVKDIDQEIMGAVATFADITRRKRQAEELERHRERLQELVDERTRALKAANRRLQQEVVERRQVEQATRRSESQYRELFDEAPVGYHEIDQAGRLIRINRTELSMLGYEEEQMLDRPVWEFIVESDAARAAVVQKLSGNVPPGKSYSRTFKASDGGELAVVLEDRIMRDECGNVVGIRTTILTAG